MGLGRISEVDQYISITHGAYPVVPQDEGRRTWLVPVLEGLYTEWLGEQGGDPSLSARLADVAWPARLWSSIMVGTTERRRLTQL